MSVKNIATVLAGVFGAHNTSSPDQGNKPTVLAADWTQFAKKYASVRVVVDSATSTTGEIGLFTCRAASGIVVTKCSILPEAALTSSNTDYATFELNQRTAGGTAVVVGSLTTKTTAASGSGDWTALVPLTVSITDGVTVANGDTLTIKESKAGGGVAAAARQFQLEYVEL